MPDSSFTVVDLPAPFGPMQPDQLPPASRAKETRSRARTVRCRLLAMPRTAPHSPGRRSATR